MQVGVCAYLFRALESLGYACAEGLALPLKRRNKKESQERKRRGEELRLQKAWNTQNGPSEWESSVLEQEGENLK